MEIDVDPQTRLDDSDTRISAQTFIKIIHHPHNESGKPTVIPLDASQTLVTIKEPIPMNDSQLLRPWAPFRTLPDFEYAESAVTGALSKDTVNRQLRGMRSSWAERSNITFQNYDDMAKSLAAAREYGIKFRTGNVSAKFQNETFHFEFRFRDPWEWVRSLVTDSTLCDSITWYPVQKYLHDGGRITRLIDEPHTAKTWWQIQSTLPRVAGKPHCFLPLLLWLDKGNVTRKVKKHPILLRASFLPRKIRNASGNGGGVLIGYMPVIYDRADPDDRNDTEALDWACFKWQVYHEVLLVIFANLRRPASSGEAVECGDRLMRVLYPGIPFQSLDGEEACVVSDCRSALANHPCPRCLVHKDELSAITETFPARTVSHMQRVYQQAVSASNKTEREHILQGVGLHFTENFFWSLANSCPYSGPSYETLHSDDLGKFGKHIWPLLLDILASRGMKGKLTANMRNVPRWKNLKHMPNVTTIEYADGQTFLDILRCLLPCIVQLLPKNDPLIPCTRSYARYRLLIDMDCMTEGRIQRLRKYIAQYRHHCTEVTAKYGKNFNFYKQHWIAHVIEDIENKGTTDNFVARPGEGFHQEVKEAWDQTNCKDTDLQMTRIDENQEVIAQIRMRVDEVHQCQSSARDDQDLPGHSLDNVVDAASMHWELGSPLRVTSSIALEAEMKHHKKFRQFHSHLCDFLAKNLIEEAIPVGVSIKIIPHQVLYIKYQSLENWTEAEDILRCNPSFHDEPRYDCAIINVMDSRHLVCAQLQSLLRCILPSGNSYDVAAIHALNPNSWRPNTNWDGCSVYKLSDVISFVFLKYLVRGAHFIPVSDAMKDSLHYLNDTVDSDMFLRTGN